MCKCWSFEAVRKDWFPKNCGIKKFTLLIVTQQLSSCYLESMLEHWHSGRVTNSTTYMSATTKTAQTICKFQRKVQRLLKLTTLLKLLMTMFPKILRLFLVQRLQVYFHVNVLMLASAVRAKSALIVTKLEVARSVAWLIALTTAHNLYRAELLLTIPGGSYITLSTFGKQLTEIAQTDEPTREKLIAAEPFTARYKSGVINTVSRSQY